MQELSNKHFLTFYELLTGSCGSLTEPYGSLRVLLDRYGSALPPFPTLQSDKLRFIPLSLNFRELWLFKPFLPQEEMMKPLPFEQRSRTSTSPLSEKVAKATSRSPSSSSAMSAAKRAEEKARALLGMSPTGSKN